MTNTNRFESYIQKHSKYISNKQLIKKKGEQKDSLRQKIESKESFIKKESARKSTLIDGIDEAEKSIKTNQAFYEWANGNPYDQTEEKNFIHKRNEFNDLGLFNKKQKESIEKYSTLKKLYVSKRISEINTEEQKIQGDEQRFLSNKSAYVNEKITAIDSEFESKINKKKKTLSKFLKSGNNAEDQVALESIELLIKEKLEPEMCGDSEERLIRNLLHLNTADDFNLEEKFNLAHFKKNREEYSSARYTLFNWTITIILMVVFMMGYSPMSFLIPSSTSFAGAANGVVKGGGIVLAIVVSLIIGIIILLIFSNIGHPILGAILSIGAFIYAFVHFLEKFRPSIAASTLGTVGATGHNIIGFIVNLIFTLIIVWIVDVLLRSTSLAAFFFVRKTNIKSEIFKRLSEDVKKNADLYIALYNHNQAITYAVENRIRFAKDSIVKQKTGIEKETTYISYEEKCNNEIKGRQDTRTYQLSQIKQAIETNKTSAITMKNDLKSLDNRIATTRRTITTLESDLTKLEGECSDLVDQNKTDEFDLLQQTREFFYTDDEFTAMCNVRNNVQELKACKGRLSNQIYFVRKQKDQYGMAELKRMNLNCKPTVFVYDRKEITDNNLAEGLSPFIKWFAEAVRRANPAALLYRWFNVVDMISGNGILTMYPYNSFVQLVGDDRGKRALAAMYSEKEMKISSDMSRPDIRKIGGALDNLDDLNEIKMKMNEPDIVKMPNLPINQLWEKVHPYHFVLFIVPDTTTNGAGKSVLNEELKKIFMNVDHYGIIPVFLISSDTLYDSNNQDAAYLQGIMNKDVYHIRNVGKINEKILDIDI